MMMPSPTTRRAALLLAAVALTGCSVLPERPYQEVQRFVLRPERPETAPPALRGPVLLVRGLRGAPGMEARGLRILRPNGVVEVEYWSEWAAPPVEATEDSLRQWLAASGLFSAVVGPGSRLRPDLVLEGELLRLHAEPAQGIARAGLSVLLLRQQRGDAGDLRIAGQFPMDGTAPLPGGARSAGQVASSEAAAAMVAALGDALGRLEAALRTTLARPG